MIHMTYNNDAHVFTGPFVFVCHLHVPFLSQFFQTAAVLLILFPA